jgi:hypothetical protein
MPTFLDTPELEALIVEAPDANGPYGAKESGEGPLHSSIPAIANAIYDAVGIRLDRIPFSPPRVLAALAERRRREQAGELAPHKSRARRGPEERLMLRLPQFEVESPETVEGVVAALQANAGRAGDRRRHGHPAQPQALPRHAADADQPGAGDGAARGGTRRRSRGAADRRRGDAHAARGARRGAGAVPEPGYAAGVVASPVIRNMATLGGNVNLDTRCRYVNQSEFWRGAIGGGCLKSEGNVCHVVPKGRNCVAAMSSDNVPVLISLDASIVLVGPEGRRELPLADYYHADGIAHTAGEARRGDRRAARAAADGPRRTRYVKWSVRHSIDFPLLSVALRFDLAGESAHAEVTSVKIVAGVLGAKPRAVTRLDEVLGKKLVGPGGGAHRQRGDVRAVQAAGQRPLRGELPARDAAGVHAARGRGDGRRWLRRCARCCSPGRSTRRCR